MKTSTFAPVFWGRPRFPSAAIFVGLAALACVAAMPLLSEYGLQIGFRLLIYIALAEAWNLLAGYAGLVSLGSSAFIGTGGYVLMALMNKVGMPLAPALAFSGAGAAILALVVSVAVFRMRGLYFTVGTLALGEALRMFMVNVPFFGGASGIFLDVDPAPARVLYLYAFGLVLVSSSIVSLAVGTRWSVILRAIREDEDAAAQFGVRPFRTKLAVFVVASFIMGTAGALQAYKLAAVEPYGMFGLNWSVDILAIVIIGGAGLRLGPIVGAVFVVALGELLANYPELHIAITGVILILVIRFAPKGLCGLAMEIAGRWKTAQVGAT